MFDYIILVNVKVEQHIIQYNGRPAEGSVTEQGFWIRYDKITLCLNIICRPINLIFKPLNIICRPIHLIYLHNRAYNWLEYRIQLLCSYAYKPYLPYFPA